ncbi:MAG: ATP-binding protein [Clostridia bacterium]|nr:ATP-binding protein [Clostridia bacterium]
MAYNVKNFRRIREEYREKYKKAEADADARRRELWEKVDGLRALDAALSATGPRLLNAILGKSSESFEKVKSDVERLNQERSLLLATYGFPPDYSDPRYECEKCRDSGYVDGEICECMKLRLRLAGYESSGIAKLMDEQTFETFRLDYYKTNQRSYENMSYVLRTMREYAENFNPDRSGNLLLLGGTGLGKTHLSTALAKTLIDNGYDVVYSGAIGMIADFEQHRFGNSAGGESGNDLDRYYACDLLIIDDLGAEVSNQFTVSTIYNVLNNRISLGLPTVISTNLNQNELNARYWDRITSRILGEFRPLIFSGSDVRKLKLTE